MMKRTLTILLVLAMLVGNLAVIAFADEGNLGSGTPDGEPPVLESIELSADTVNAPGSIEITMRASDDVSGVQHAQVEFYCEKTRKYLYAHLDGGYWYYDKDAGREQYVSYGDGILKGTLNIDQYVMAGDFQIRSIYLTDLANNDRWYHRYEESGDNRIPDDIQAMSLYVDNGDVPDGTAPVLENVELSTDMVDAPGKIEITMKASDDVSGVQHAQVEFYCEKTRKYLYAHLDGGYWYYDKDAGREQFVSYGDGILKGTLAIDQYVVTGDFRIQSIYLTDLANNDRWYHRYEESGDNRMSDDVQAISLHVNESDTPDGTAPVLEGLELTTWTMAAPGVIEMTMKARDDVSGVQHAQVEFYCQETKKTLYGHLDGGYWYYDKDAGREQYVSYGDGILKGKLHIDQYVVAGDFQIRSVYLTDLANNDRWYHRYEEDDNCIPESMLDLRLSILNAVPDVSTSVSKPEFVDQIESAADNAYITADFSGEATLPETAFEALSGTDKTLDLVSEGVTWRFNGADIVNDAKPIDLTVDIKPIEENTSEAAQEIQEKLDAQSAVVLKFAENGELPGKATIQVKVDYAMREYLGTGEPLCVYYFNNQTGKLELIAENLVVINDTYVEFAITHCSYYVLTQKIAEEPEEPEEPGDVKLGDVNGDGKINPKDAAMVLQHFVDKPVQNFNAAAADVNADGKINPKDAAMILQRFVDKLDENFKPRG